MERAIVIGGGIVGSSAAYRLALAGVKTTLVDDDVLGQATAAGAGIIAPGQIDTLPSAWYPLAFRGAAYYPELLALLAEDGEKLTGYRRVGELLVARTENEQETLIRLHDLLDERKSAGVTHIEEISRISTRDAKLLFPLLNERAMEALHLSGPVCVDGALLRDALQRATLAHGGQIIRSTAQLVVGDNSISYVQVDGRRMLADEVLVAAGAWAGQLLGDLGLGESIYPQRGQIIHLELAGTATSDWPVVSWCSLPSHYIVAFPEHAIAAGATWEDEAGYDYRVTVAGQYELLREALQIAPQLASAAVVETRVGFRPATRDYLPLVGRVPGIRGLLVASGLGSFGLTMGPFVGAAVADIALERTLDLDLTPFAPSRFVTNT